MKSVCIIDDDPEVRDTIISLTRKLRLTSEAAGALEAGMELLTRERDPEERMFNCKYVREMCRNNDALSEHWPVENPRSEAMGGDVVVNG